MIQLKFERDWCHGHLEPYRQRWPGGAATAILLLFQAFVARPEISTYCSNDASRLELALGEFGPACCFVGDDVMERIRLLSLEGGAAALTSLASWRWLG